MFNRDLHYASIQIAAALAAARHPHQPGPLYTEEQIVTKSVSLAEKLAAEIAKREQPEPSETEEWKPPVERPLTGVKKNAPEPGEDAPKGDAKPSEATDSKDAPKGNVEPGKDAPDPTSKPDPDLTTGAATPHAKKHHPHR